MNIAALIADLPDEARVAIQFAGESLTIGDLRRAFGATEVVVERPPTLEDVVAYLTSRECFSAMLDQRVGRVEPPIRLPGEGEWVYYIQCETTLRVKIGFSTNLSSRIGAIGASTILRLLAMEEGGPDLELERHRQFSESRSYDASGREWFELTRELYDHIAGLGGDPLLLPAPPVSWVLARRIIEEEGASP